MLFQHCIFTLLIKGFLSPLFCTKEVKKIDNSICTKRGAATFCFAKLFLTVHGQPPQFSSSYSIYSSKAVGCDTELGL